MKKLFFIGAAAVLTAVSCSKTSKTGSTAQDDKNKIVVSHLSGSTAVGSSPKNVVILQYGMVDTYQELGLEKYIKGIPLSELPRYLSNFKDKPDMAGLGTTMEANMEKVNELDPDLIIIGSRMGPKYEQFAKIAPTVTLEADQKDYWRTFSENHTAIGKLYHKEKEVAERLDRLALRIKSIKAKAAKTSKRALIVLANEGKMSVYGPGSRFGLIHDVLGFRAADANIEISSHGQSVSSEYIQQVNPDIIFVIDRGAALKREKATMEQFANVLIRQTNAYKAGSIVFLDPELWYLSGGGLKSFNMMLDEIDGTLN